MKIEKVINWLMERDVFIWAIGIVGKRMSDRKTNPYIPRPLKKEPNFEHLRKVLLKETTEGPVPIIEYSCDPELMVSAVGWKDFPIDIAKAIMWGVSHVGNLKVSWVGLQFLELALAFSKAVGYDYVTTYPHIPFPRTYHKADLKEEHGGKWRAWEDETVGLIPDRAAFEAFPWPSTDEIGLFSVKYMAKRMPPGMKLMIYQHGIFADLKLLMGLENFAVKTIDDPDLVVDIAEKLTVLAEAALSKACALPDVGCVFVGDDMGFKQGTFINPRFTREHIIPRQKRIVDVVKKYNLPFLLHSCGNLEAIMDDLIDTGIDAKHSFEDNICPVEKMYEKYHDKIAILGGVDMDLLSRGSVEDVRKRTREILEACAPGGGYAMGSGNTLASYIPLENYYAMIDETIKYNEEKGANLN